MPCGLEAGSEARVQGRPAPALSRPQCPWCPRLFGDHRTAPSPPQTGKAHGSCGLGVAAQTEGPFCCPRCGGAPIATPPPIRFLGTAPRTESFPRPAPPSGQLSLLTADVPVKVRTSRRVHVGERTGVRGVWSPSPRRPPAAGSLPSPPTTCGGLAVRRAPRRALPLNSVGPHDSPVT